MREEKAGEARSHLAQLDLLLFAPGEKAPHGMGIGAAGVGTGEAGREELVGGGEDGILPGALQEGGEGHRPWRWCGERSRSPTSTITTFIVLYGLGHTATFFICPSP